LDELGNLPKARSDKKDVTPTAYQMRICISKKFHFVLSVQ